MDVSAVFIAIVSFSCTVIVWFLLTVDLTAPRLVPRFSLRSLFLITAMAAGFSYLVYWCHHAHYVQVYAVRDALAEHPEIDRVWLGTNNDVELEVEQVYFSIKGQPEITFYSDGIDYVGKREFRKRLERALKERQPVVRPDWVVEYGIR